MRKEPQMNQPNTGRLFRVTYAVASKPRIIGVVWAASGREAIELIDKQEIMLGRGPINREATDWEYVK